MSKKITLFRTINKDNIDNVRDNDAVRFEYEEHMAAKLIASGGDPATIKHKIEAGRNGHFVWIGEADAR